MPNNNLDRVFYTLSNATRRAVVSRLGQGPATMTELAEPFDMALPSFLQHLNVLEEAGLVRSEKVGRVRTYRLEPQSLIEEEHWIDAHRRQWTARLDQFETALKETEIMNSFVHTPDPSLDLLLERVVDVPAAKIWEGWTNPELIKKWFTPRPWSTIECEIDLRPGGTFRNVMRSPEGQEFPNEGCILEVVPGRKLVWTSAMGPGFRPHASGVGVMPEGFVFTAVISVEDLGGKTKYSALVIHGDEEAKNKHEAMGFHGGWSTALDQLVELIKEGQVCRLG